MTTIPGTGGSDVLIGTSADNIFNAGAGDDTIRIGIAPGNDTFNGGDGTDSLQLTADVSINKLRLNAASLMEVLRFEGF